MALIDWFTVAAQIVNFLILVFLLKRFLYGPIIRAMDERQAQIEADLAAAERKRQEAGQEIETYRQKNREIEAQREKLLRQAAGEADEERKRLVHAAREEADESRSRWRKGIEQEKAAFLRELRQRAGQETYAALRRALADLADVELEERITAVFIGRLEQLSPEDRAVFDGRSATVETAFDLPDAARERLRAALNDLTADLQFKRNPDLLCGLELKASGHKIAWSLQSYLDELEEALTETLASM
jgi:F-type H+-transporting ATPase subunit b